MLEFLWVSLKMLYCKFVFFDHKYVEQNREVRYHNFKHSSAGPCTPEEWDEVEYKCSICGKITTKYENYRDYEPNTNPTCEK